MGHKYVFSCPPINHTKSLPFRIFKKSLIPTEFLIILFRYNKRRVALYNVVVWEASGSREWASSRLASLGLQEPPVLEILDTFVQMTCQVGPLCLLSLAYQVLFCAMIQQQKVGWHSPFSHILLQIQLQTFIYVELKVLCWNSFIYSQKF